MPTEPNKSWTDIAQELAPTAIVFGFGSGLLGVVLAVLEAIVWFMNRSAHGGLYQIGQGFLVVALTLFALAACLYLAAIHEAVLARVAAEKPTQPPQLVAEKRTRG